MSTPGAMTINSRKVIDGEAGINAHIQVKGIVQGVGFRPFIWNLAHQFDLAGQVRNDSSGVEIDICGKQRDVELFICHIEDTPPPLAKIHEIRCTVTPDPVAYAGFFIVESVEGAMHTCISPDAATCPECIEDIRNPFNHRFRYALTNCTHCGPRFSIIRNAPYDRQNTAMSEYALCQSCESEYKNPKDRRFHAQPNACYDCGPAVKLERFDGKPVCLEALSQLDDIDAACTLLQSGEIIAIKGIGGFHLACDATNDRIVTRLRQAKKRFSKPFALMARDVDIIKRYAHVSSEEESLLVSLEAPIVLLQKKNQLPEDHARKFGEKHGERAIDLKPVSAQISPGVELYGFMLPYTPLHHLLLKRMNRPIVLTSANLSDEPQCISNNDAVDRLAGMADFVLWHDREIVNRVDDSVVRIIADKPRLLRRSRGYAPAPLSLPSGFKDASDLLAMGGELKNTFCLIKDGRLVLSQHIGDLEDAATLDDYQYNLTLYQKLFDHDPEYVVIDRHPEYISGKIGREMANHGKRKLIEVQHHHAHLAACLAENQWPFDGGKVLGIVLDGLGFGDNGELWGGEFLYADYCSYQRLATFKPVAMLGGSMAMREPWRNTYAHLMAELGWDQLKINFAELDLIHYLESKPLKTFNQMLETGMNSPLASSCGRLFDAFAAAIGICRDSVNHEGEAAIQLESIIDRDALEKEHESLIYPFAAPRLGHTDIPYIEPLAMWQAVLGDLILKTPKGVMSARFHRGLAKGIAEMVKRIIVRDEERITDTIVLSGGVFQNKVLFEEVHKHLDAMDYRVLSHSATPANDGCISLGQAIIGLAQQNSFRRI